MRSTFPFAKPLHEKKELDEVVLDYSKACDSVSFNCLSRELYGVSIKWEYDNLALKLLTERWTVIDG